MWAAMYGYDDIVELLIKWKADVKYFNATNGSALQLAEKKRNRNKGPQYDMIIKMLKDAGAA